MALTYSSAELALNGFLVCQSCHNNPQLKLVQYGCGESQIRENTVECTQRSFSHNGTICTHPAIGFPSPSWEPFASLAIVVRGQVELPSSRELALLVDPHSGLHLCWADYDACESICSKGRWSGDVGDSPSPLVASGPHFRAKGALALWPSHRERSLSSQNAGQDGHTSDG